MSHSPRDALTISLNSDYLQATRMLDRMNRAGFSWSGNEKDVALLNTGVSSGGVRFADISAISGFNSSGDGRAVALTDWDHDGDIDAWVMSRTAPQIRFLENSTRSNKVAGPAFLMLHLEGDGSKCSRDATGARAELVLAGSGPRLIRAVHTGDTHCSHSTHWLHFGLGDNPANTKVQKLVVRWPDGETASFAGLEPGRHYVLKRGGKPERLPLRRTESPAPPAVRSAPPPAGLTIYSNRLPPPPLAWQDFDGKPRALTEYKDRSVALLLWAGWCRNCREELTSLAARAAQLEKAGVTLVALNMDAATVEAGGDVAKARALWQAAAVPADSGEADTALMGRLESFHGSLHWVGGPLRIPGLFLFDAEGRLVAHAEGVMENQAWNRALSALAAPPEKWMDLALPFAGRRYGQFAPIRMADVPQHLMEDGATGLAEEYIAAHGQAMEAACRAGKEPGFPRVLYTVAVDLAGRGKKAEAARHYRMAVDLKPAFIDARYNLAGMLRELGQTDKALDEYTTLVANVPGHAAAWHNRAMIRHEAGDLEGAAADYRQALLHAPGNLDTMNNLGNVLMTLKRDDEALPLFTKALEAAPGDARTHYNYALALEQAVRWNEAATAYRQAMELDPRNAQYPHNLGVLRAKQSRWDEAETLLKQALELQPDHPTASRNLQRVIDMRSKR